jgi:hypothetical protein
MVKNVSPMQVVSNLILILDKIYPSSSLRTLLELCDKYICQISIKAEVNTEELSLICDCLCLISEILHTDSTKSFHILKNINMVKEKSQYFSDLCEKRIAYYNTPV